MLRQSHKHHDWTTESVDVLWAVKSSSGYPLLKDLVRDYLKSQHSILYGRHYADVDRASEAYTELIKAIFQHGASIKDCTINEVVNYVLPY